MPPTPSVANRLLVALALEDLELLRPHLEVVPLPHKQTLSEPNTPIDHVYFVQEGMVSLVQPLENGAMIEVGMIGNEGFLGVPVLLGAESSPLEAMVQIPGSALRMQASAFREEGPEFRSNGTAASVCSGTPHSGLTIGGMQRATHVAGAPCSLAADCP
jgi:CRP-like cAMP-binding protein